MPPRPVFKNKTYLVTRRCSDRRFFLRPSPVTNKIVTYLLGLAASRYRLQFHGWVVMSNHIHLVLTDVDGLLPEAMHFLVLQTSKAVGAEIGRWGGFWEQRRYSRVELIGTPTIVAKIAYTITNPVTAGRVKHSDQWPGVTSANWAYGEAKTFRKPDCKYLTGAEWEEFATLELVPPPGMSNAQADEAVAERVQRREKAMQRLLRLRRRRSMKQRVDGPTKFAGVGRVLAQNPFDQPRTREKRQRLDPTFAAGDEQARIGAAERKRAFELAYREALEAWRSGDRDVVFPPGTWAMVRYHGCRCESLH